MGRQTHNFTLADRHGEEHAYQCTEHPTDEGFDLQLDLAEILATVPSVVLAGLEAMESLDTPDDAKPGNAPAPPVFNPAALGGAVAAIPQAIAKAGGHRLLVRILKHTKRQAVDKGTFQPLSSELQRDEAYAGNYAELYRAVWEVVKANFDPFSMVNTDDLKEAWQKLQSWLPKDEEEEEDPTTA
jgi:hypothetical protein